MRIIFPLNALFSLAKPKDRKPSLLQKFLCLFKPTRIFSIPIPPRRLRSAHAHNRLRYLCQPLDYCFRQCPQFGFSFRDYDGKNYSRNFFNVGKRAHIGRFEIEPPIPHTLPARSAASDKNASA
ncbi:MAG: hypothetical protein UY42_C0001G0004 [Parcubacteria group bacterium GW2011_GWA2_49_16]|nr:MAG: hypothetical protein UY42_C0001G0004 [Parcubacteria group bacterium GW2011_GWA2_49_16]